MTDLEPEIQKRLSKTLLFAKERLALNLIYIEEIFEGKNNRVFRFHDNFGKRYIIKLYIVDDRHRMEREFISYRFLKSNGIENIPESILSDFKAYSAIFTEVAGTQKAGEDIDKGDATQIVNFLHKVDRIKYYDTVEVIPFAVNARLRLFDYIKQIDIRVKTITNLINERKFSDNVLMWIEKENPTEYIIKARDRIIDELDYNLLTKRNSFNDFSLTPIDFSINNFLFNHKGANFIDFEYFGWDDRYRSISEFYCHRRSLKVNEEIKKEIVSNYAQRLSLSKEERTKMAYSIILTSLEWLIAGVSSLTPQTIEVRKFGNPNIDLNAYAHSQFEIHTEMQKNFITISEWVKKEFLT